MIPKGKGSRSLIKMNIKVYCLSLDIITNEVIEILPTMGYEQRTWWCCVLNIRLCAFIILKQPNIGMRMEFISGQNGGWKVSCK